MILTLYWKAYPMGRDGIKSCRRGHLLLPVEHRLFSLAEMIEVARPKILEQHPDLASCPIQIIDCNFQEKLYEPLATD